MRDAVPPCKTTGGAGVPEPARRAAPEGPAALIRVRRRRGAGAVVRMGLLGRLGAGSCPNLLQRRPGPGSAPRRSAEYQRFASGTSTGSGPLQQIWTTRCRGPLRGRRPRRSPRPPGRPAPPPRAPKRALCTRAGTFNCTSREQNAHLDEHRTDPPPPPRTASARATPAHGPRLPVRKAQWDGVSHVVTRPVHWDHKWSSGRAPPRARRRPRDDPHYRPLNSLPDLRGPRPACVMRAQRNGIHPASRRAGSARHDPPALDPREPTWRNAT